MKGPRNPFAPVSTLHDKRVKSQWSCETVANLLFEQLPVEDRLPGSPTLRIVMEDNTVVLRQFYGKED